VEDGVLYNKNKTVLHKYPAGKTGSFFTIPDSVTSIGQDAFVSCTSLTSVTIPNSVTSIGQGAFAGCTNLTSVTIPNSVTNIGDRAFYSCTSLTAINVVANNTEYTVEDGVLYNKNKTVLHTYPAGKTGSFFTIPNSVTSIGQGAFSSCESLTSVTIPNSVTSIGNTAFSSCESLTSITIPDSVTSIGNYAFYLCDNLTSVTIPNSVTSIGQGAFAGCTNLTSVTFQGTIASSEFSISNAFNDDLRDKFYATDADNGTPGTYTTTAPVRWDSVWTKQ